MSEFRARGRILTEDGGVAVDTVDGTVAVYEIRPGGNSFRIACIKCGLEPTAEGYDACLGHLPGVKNACCGHGVGPGYIHFDNDVTVRFERLAIDDV